MTTHPVVTCPAGTITGVRLDDGTHRFHSIPYSVIEHDYADAIARPGGETIDATTPEPNEIALSVTVPERFAKDRPVIVYIHGGRFEHGTHEDPRADGASAAQSGVVLVQVGYRVGLSGLATFSDDEPHRYRAIDDCLLALEWVQKNIEAFGGDPTNVTVVGQSAGATTALWLSRRDHYRGGFRRVVACSPCFPRRSWNDRKSLFRPLLGKPLTRTSLRRQPQRKVAKAYRRFRTLLSTDMALGPHPLDTAEMADVDIVITSTRDEYYNLPFPAWLDKRGLGPAAARIMARPLGMTGTIPSWIAAAREIDPDRIGGRLISDAIGRRWAQYIADGAPGTVWMAEFTRTKDKPALHCAELRPLFATGPYSPEHPLHRWLMRYAATGDPGWEPYAAETGRQAMEMRLDTGTMTPVTDPLKSVRLAFPAPYGSSASRRR